MKRNWGFNFGSGIIAVTVFSMATPSARAGFDLGDSANYAVLYEGAGSHNLQVNSGPVNGSTVSGNIGLGIENGGNPQFQPSNPAVINGNINFAAGTANINNSGAVINGTINAGVSQVETDLNNLNALSSSLGLESGTPTAISIANGGTMTINASNGILDANGNRVFTVSSLSFVNGATLNINGDAAGDSVVLNFNFNTHFSGTINLIGGLNPNQVLFNIIGGMNMMNGDTLQFAANNVSQEGTFLDPNGTITENSVNLDGHLFGGDTADMQIVSGGTVVNPAPEPQTFAVLALGLASIVGYRRLLRSNKAVVSR